MNANAFLSILVFSLLAVPLETHAQELTSNPTALQILRQTISAFGGEELLGGLNNWHAKGLIQVSGYSGTYELWAQTPNSTMSVVDLEVIRVETGFDGIEAWERRGRQVKTLDSEPLAVAKRNGLFMPLLHYLKHETAVTNRGRQTIDDREAWVLEFSLENGNLEQHFIDTQSYLPIQEIRIPAKADEENLTIRYGDYRGQNGIQFPFSVIRSSSKRTIQIDYESYVLNTDIAEKFFVSPAKKYEGEPFQASLSTVPRRIFKENDGIFGNGPSESWYFHLLVDEKHARALESKEASLKFFSGDSLMETHNITGVTLSAIKNVSFTGLAALSEVFDLRFSYSRPVSLAIDRIMVELILSPLAGDDIRAIHEVHLENYVPKTELSFPLQGAFIALAAADFNEPHAQEWSQHHALDILALGPNLQLMRGEGSQNQDYETWGRTVFAPADGIVSYARNDVPDNAKPNQIDTESFTGLPDRLWSIGGNCVVIDHGNGEYSFLAHMQKGSVKVQTGDRVSRGDELGLLGNSGNSSAPHLHFHLMAGDTLFRSDPLPLRFNNVFFSGIASGKLLGPIKRGIYLESTWEGK